MRRNLLFFVGIFLVTATSLIAKDEDPFQFITLDQENAVLFDEELAVEKTKEQPVLPKKKTKKKIKQQSEQLELVELNSKSFAPQENSSVKEEEALLDQSVAAIDQDLYQPAKRVVEREDKEEPTLSLELAEPEVHEPFITSSPEEENAVFTTFKEKAAKHSSSAKELRENDVKALAKAHSVEKVIAPNKLSADPSAAIQVSFAQVFAGSPVIYSILLALSVFAFCVCLYNLLSLRPASENFTKKIRQKLMSNQFDEALSLCLRDDHLFGRVVSAAISTRKHGLPHMLETMKTEGKRATVSFWQRIALLNDIAIVAPMLGLLGTVLGMFYAFYDLNRSRDSVNTLFDGLGISVGTTVAGLAVAIFAMMLHSFAKFRLVRVLASVEEEAQSLAALMEAKPSFPGEKL